MLSMGSLGLLALFLRNPSDPLDAVGTSCYAAQPALQDQSLVYLPTSRFFHLVLPLPIRLLSLFFRGCDFHLSVDGNFNHRHLKQAGDGPQPHVLRLYLSAEFVNEVGDHIDSVRKKKPKQRTPKVPDEAVDECEDGHIAGTGTNVKTSTRKYDDTGTMALVCRHDIPVFLANIDTPGEQQKYAVALIKKLFTMIPANATVAIFYDVGCVLDRSLEPVRVQHVSAFGGKRGSLEMKYDIWYTVLNFARDLA
jgi:hypothetical protein